LLWTEVGVAGDVGTKPKAVVAQNPVCAAVEVWTQERLCMKMAIRKESLLTKVKTVAIIA